MLTKKKLSFLRKWFDDYCLAFESEDPKKAYAYELKYQHTMRVCKAALDIGCHAELEDYTLHLAEIAALFHDLGRFEQFSRYSTFSDGKSVNHADIALEILRQYDVLKDLDVPEQEIVNTAIANHNKKEIASDVQGDRLLHCRLLRDADKADIYHVVTHHYENGKNGHNSSVHLELPDTPGYNSEAVKALKNKSNVSYRTVSNLNDFKLVQVGMVFDINFPRTCEILLENNYIGRLFDVLPSNDELKAVRMLVNDHLKFCLSPAK